MILMELDMQPIGMTLHSRKTGYGRNRHGKDDTSGTELGWFAIFTAEDTVERPILIISMVEDVKGRGGSGYVVKKDSLVLEEWFSSN